MAQLLSGGLDTRTVAEIREELVDEISGDISPSIDLSTTNPLGQIVSIFSNQLAETEEALSQLVASIDPEMATSVGLDRICSLHGVTRRAGTKSALSCSLLFSQTGEHAAGTLIAYPSGSSTNLFTNVSAVSVTSVPLTASNVLFRAISTGSVQVILGTAGALTLTNIASPIAGWDRIYGTSNLSIGTNIETDAQLRIRRQSEIFKAGSTSTNGIRAAIISRVSGVYPQGTYIVENTSSNTVDSIPPHSFEAVVWSTSEGTDSQIAEAIHSSKAAAGGTYGTSYYDVVDSTNITRRIYFTRPAEIPLRISASIDYEPGNTYPGITAVKTNIITSMSSTMTPNKDLTPGLVTKWIMSTPGVTNVRAVKINEIAQRYVISTRQIAVITSSANIIIEDAQVEV
jgi:hypothetical protein